MDVKNYFSGKITVKNILKAFALFISTLMVFPIIFISGYYYRIHRENIETKMEISMNSNTEKQNYKIVI